MKEHPILFSGEMVRAILDGKKTQTRRVIKPQPIMMSGGIWYPSENPGDFRNRTGLHYANEHHLRFGLAKDFCIYGQPGDHLWVRETWGAVSKTEFTAPIEECNIEYRADLPAGCTDYPGGWEKELACGDPETPKWFASIHMPRWASRITLEIVNVRVEKVQEITNEDAVAEGFYKKPNRTWGRLGFSNLLDDLNAKRGFGWDTNPWVWVIEFKRLHD